MFGAAPNAYDVGSGGPVGGMPVQWSGAVPSLKLATGYLVVTPIGGIGHLVVSTSGGGGVSSVGDLEIGDSGNVGPVSNIGRVIRISANGSVARAEVGRASGMLCRWTTSPV